MIENLLKKLHIKTNPNKIATFFFYGITAVLVFFAVSRMLSFLVGDARIENNITPYVYSLFLVVPPLAFSFFVNSGIPKSDKTKIKWYIITCILFGIILGSMTCTWINQAFWWLIQKFPNYDKVKLYFPELFAPAIKTTCFAVPFVAIFSIIDYFLLILRDEDLPKSIAGFVGLSLTSSSKDNGMFSCETIICNEKESSIPVIVPETKRYEGTLVQGATGTGKTATVLLPMSALDLERKYFFREYSKKIGYAMLKKGIAYMNGPFNNEYINRNFSLSYLKPKRGMEEQFLTDVKSVIQFQDNATGKMYYKDIGITIVENDGKFISDFIGVAKNFDIDVLSIDPANPDTLSINPFAIEDPAKVASIVADVLNSMYEDQGGGGAGDPFFTQVTIDAFQNLSILLKEMYPRMNDGEVASLEDMLELLYNFDKVEEMTEEMKKIPELEQKYKLLIAYFEKNFYKPSLNINGYEIPGTRGSGRKDTEKFLYGAITQLNNLIRNPGLKRALCGKTNMINFDKALEDGRVITACSRKGDLGVLQAKAFGMFFILQFQDAVLRRKGTEDTRTPHFLYIDEFPEYINKDMEVMFTLFRKYRCGVTIALQNLSQLSKGDKKGSGYYRQTVLANTKTQIVFGDTVPEDSAYWEKAFGINKIPDASTSYKIVDGELVGSSSIEVKKKTRAEAYKIQDLGFKAVFFKTKDAKGKTIYGKGKTDFLNSKYKQKSHTLMFNFEKYMMTKPDTPTITLNDSDSANDDTLFGVNTSTKLNQELEKKANESIVSNAKDYSANQEYKEQMQREEEKAVELDNLDNFDIIFENIEPTLDDASNGGAITEKYETAAIKKNKK